jgi:5-methylcytosine-specific restriction endonuclease McrA
MWPDGNSMIAKKRKNRNTDIKILLWESARFRQCHWCGIIIEFRYATVDHVVAIAENGQKERINCVLSCWPCNHERGIITQLKQMMKKSEALGGKKWRKRIQQYVEKMDCVRLANKWAEIYQIKNMIEELYNVPNLN